MRVLNNCLLQLGKALAELGPRQQLRSCCVCCNAAYGCNEQQSASMPHILEPYSHTVVCLLSLCLAFMRWQHPALEQAQDALLVLFVKPSDMLTYDSADEHFPRISSHIAPRGSMPVLTVILAIAFVDNGITGTPHAAHLAADLISCIVARRPASCFGLLDPQPAVEAVFKLLGDISDRVQHPHCLVEECFGTVQVPCKFYPQTLNLPPTFSSPGNQCASASLLPLRLARQHPSRSSLAPPGSHFFTGHKYGAQLGAREAVSFVRRQPPQRLSDRHCAISRA
jgi:hypothetical protein